MKGKKLQTDIPKEHNIVSVNDISGLVKKAPLVPIY
jgi:hypothetical protein